MQARRDRVMKSRPRPVTLDQDLYISMTRSNVLKMMRDSRIEERDSLIE